MPRGKIEISVNSSSYTLAIALQAPIEHYYITNLGTNDVILSHDGQQEHDVISAGTERYYDFDLQKTFYFKAVNGNSTIRLVWW